MRIVLVGGGDLARQITHYIGTYDVNAKVAGYVDDFAEYDEERFGIRCLGSINSLFELKNKGVFDFALIAIGYANLEIRQRLFENLSKHIDFYTFVHPTAFVDKSAVIGVGCCIGPYAVVEQRAVVDVNVFMYGGVNVSHDSKVGAHSFVAPSVAIAGFTEIGQRCFVGLRSAIIERVCIADDVTIGAGSLVVRSLSEPGLYVGNPVKKIK